jgi:hypothetical protein
MDIPAKTMIFIATDPMSVRARAAFFSTSVFVKLFFNFFSKAIEPVWNVGFKQIFTFIAKAHTETVNW